MKLWIEQNWTNIPRLGIFVGTQKKALTFMTIKLLCFDTFMMQNLPRRHDNQQYPPMSSRCLF